MPVWRIGSPPSATSSISRSLLNKNSLSLSDLSPFFSDRSTKKDLSVTLKMSVSGAFRG